MAMPLAGVRIRSSPLPDSWDEHKILDCLNVGSKQESWNKESAATCRMTSVLGVCQILL
jgi:hypothetical protein